MMDRRPPIGTQTNLIYLDGDFQPQRTRVVNHLGNYVILENGLRFHVLDDFIGDGMWMLKDQQVSITPILNQ